MKYNDVDISSKIISLQCSWLQKLCDGNFHEWKIVPSHLINKYFGLRRGSRQKGLVFINLTNGQIGWQILFFVIVKFSL